MNKYRYNDTNGVHLHLWNEQPLTGCTSILDVLGKNLTWWAAGMAVSTLGWTNSKTMPPEQRLQAAGIALDEIKSLDDTEYLKKLDKAYRAHFEAKNDAAEKGTDRHALVEKWVKECMKEHTLVVRGDDEIAPFITWAQDNVKEFLWSEGYVCDESPDRFIGGISDIGAIMKDGSIAIIDIKSSKEAYFSQFVQIGGYDLMVQHSGIMDANGNQILKLDKPITKHIIFPFGMKVPTGIVKENVEENRQAFLHCLSLYRIKSSFEK